MVGRYAVVGIGCNPYYGQLYVYSFCLQSSARRLEGHQGLLLPSRSHHYSLALELQAGTVLHCECGEDIDHVKQLLDTDGAIPTRLLEQVKTRDKITLARHEALQPLPDFMMLG